MLIWMIATVPTLMRGIQSIFFAVDAEPEEEREMTGLQRSTVSFRRQGSSGLVWEDRFLSGELSDENSGKIKERIEPQKLKHSSSTGSIKMIAGNINGGGSGRKAIRTATVFPSVDPPSPKVSVCGFCSIFSKSKEKQNPNSGKRRP